jgi:type III pantothenate kinase
MSGVLAIDVSNRQTALALWQDEAPVHAWRLSSDPARTTDEHRLLLRQFLARDGVAAEGVAGSVLACVVPPVVAPLVRAIEELLGEPPLVVGPGVRTGLAIHTEDPREVGPDRVANAVAARAAYGAPVIVLDFSTALTVDIVGPAGDYLGALIAPGMDIAADALARRTAQLGRIDLSVPARVIATNTDDGLRAGLVLGYTGLVEGLVRRVHETIGAAPVVATGDAAWLTPLLAAGGPIDAHDPLLTLDGLRRIWRLQGEG